VASGKVLTDSNLSRLWGSNSLSLGSIGGEMNKIDLIEYLVAHDWSLARGSSPWVWSHASAPGAYYTLEDAVSLQRSSTPPKPVATPSQRPVVASKRRGGPRGS
jgi:hypothetical protein